MCNDTDIKELLPAYLDGSLELSDQKRILGHVDCCDDCSSDLSLLRLMRSEAVPDPGAAFWAENTACIARAIREQAPKKPGFDIMRLTNWLVMPGRQWASATAGAVLMLAVLSWLTMRPLGTVQTMLSQDSGPVEEVITADAIPFGHFDNDELVQVDAWAGRELASIASEAVTAIAITEHDMDLYEEIAELNAQETEQFSTMIDRLTEEG